MHKTKNTTQVFIFIKSKISCIYYHFKISLQTDPRHAKRLAYNAIVCNDILRQSNENDDEDEKEV